MNKDVLRPIAGEYDEDFLNPLSEKQFDPIYTNEEGIVKFQDLAFTTSGPAGQSSLGSYELAFVCDGQFTQVTALIQVS